MESSKNRLLKILKKEAVDRPSCISPGGMMNMITLDLMESCGISWPEAHFDSELMAKLALASYEHVCFENVGVPFCMTVEAEDFGATVNFGSNIYEPHVSKYAIESIKDYNKLKKPDISKGRAKVVIDAIKYLKAHNTDAPIIGNISGPMSVASSVLEPVELYKELRRENKSAHKLLDIITRHCIEFAKAQISAGADIIAISDPSGSGEIMGPKLFDEFIVTYINKLIDGFYTEGVGTIVHICGQMKSVYAQLAKIKSDVLSFDSVVPIRNVRKYLPGRLLMGNVSTYALEFGDKDKIAALTKNSVRSGANIISPACGIGTKSPLSNIQTIFSTLQDMKV